MEDANLILTLRASSLRAERAFSLEHNKNRYLPPAIAEPTLAAWTRGMTPATDIGDDETEDFSSQIRLAFDQELKDVQQGFVFGSDPATCDILLGPPKDRISRRHFRIAFDSQGRLILEAMSSTRTMTLSYDGQGDDQDRLLFKWILFQGPKIKVTIDESKRRGCQVRESLRFEIELAQHNVSQAKYQNNVCLFLEESRNAIAPFDLLNIYSQENTAASTRQEAPRQRPIYIKDGEIGRGEFGKVYKSIDVSTGYMYAGKYFNRGDWKNEVNIMRQVSHVCLIN